MGAAAILGLVLGLGILLILTAQPVGKSHPSIASRIDALRPDREPAEKRPSAAVFRTSLFEEILRPTLERSGQICASLAKRLGLDLKETAARLHAVGDPAGLTLFLGQKILTAVVGFAFLPAAAALGAAPSTASWMWLAAGAAGFLVPDVLLRSKAEAVRRELREDLARFADMMSLSVSAGLGLDAALDEVSRAAEGHFFEHLRRFVREARLRGLPASTALSKLADELRLREAEPMAAALVAAETQGVAVSQVFRAQARSIRERRRIEIIETGERAQTRMALPVGLLILPAFFLIVLYPAAVQLLRVTAN